MPRSSGVALPNLADAERLRAAADDQWASDEGPLHPAPISADSHLAAFEIALRSGQPWFDALLDAVRRWDLPREVVDGREYVYLIEREAFDWLLLCERLCDAAPPELLPRAEVEALLTRETPPQPLSEGEFQARIGPAKYWAHLNFLYGVRVEQALQLATERALQKESGGLTFSHARRDLERDLHSRIYGRTQDELLSDFRDQTERAHTERISQQEWQAFTYWLFRGRVERQDPARVASDTRRGLDMLRELELAAQRRRADPAAGGGRGAADPEAAEDLIDSVVVAVG